MAAPMVTIKIRAGQRLMERIRQASGYLEINAGEFVEHAIESELSRQETHRRLEDVTLNELRHSVLADGQAISIHHADEGEGQTTCQLCLKVIDHGAGVEGPVLCAACHALAKGAAAR